MFCEYCGSKMENGQKFCKSCGAPVTAKTYNNTNSPVVNKTNTINDPNYNPTITGGKKKKTNGCLIAFIVVVCVFALFGFGIYMLVKFVFGLMKTEYVKFGNDEIVTVYKVTGDIFPNSINTNYENGESRTIFEFNADEFTKDIQEEYAEALIEDDFYRALDISDYYHTYVKESKDSGYILIVSWREKAALYENGFIDEIEIIYRKIKDRLDSYPALETTSLKEVGKEKYGFISIPDDWSQMDDEGVESYITYTSEDDAITLTMDYTDAPEQSASLYANTLVNNYKSRGVDITKTTIMLDGRITYVLTIKDNKDEKIWLFDDENNGLHWISISAKLGNIYAFDYIESYHLK